MSLIRDLAHRFYTVGPESISQNPSHPLVVALGGGHSISGVPVTESIAQQLAVVFACDKVLKESIAQIPLKIVRYAANGDRQPDENHPLYTVLHDLANPVMTAKEFKECAQGHVNIYGNHYSEIQRNNRNEVIALWPLDPSRMTVDIDGLNRLRYTYRLADGRAKEYLFDPANPPIFHLRINAYDGIHGRSPIRMLPNLIGVALAAERFCARYFGQGGHPQSVFTTDQKLNKEAASRVREDLDALTVGEHNWHRNVILDYGLKPVPMASSNKDSQLLDLQKEQARRIASAYRVPAHMINDLERATFSNIEQQSIEFVTYSLMSHLVGWQQAIARDLLNPKSFNTHGAVFIVNALLRGSFLEQQNALAVQRQNGAISTNDWRRLNEMNTISEADGGDLYLVNGNMMPLKRDPAAMIEPMPAPTGGVN